MKASILATLALSAFAPIASAGTVLFTSTDADVTAVGTDPANINDKFMVKVTENLNGNQRYRIKVAYRHALNLPTCANADTSYGAYQFKRQFSAAVTSYTGLTYASITYNPCSSPEPSYTVSVYGTATDPWTTVTCANGPKCAISGASAAQSDIDIFTKQLGQTEPVMKDFVLSDTAYNGVGAIWNAPPSVDDLDSDLDDECSTTFGTYNGETVSMSYTVPLTPADVKDEFGDLTCSTKTRWLKRRHDDSWPVKVRALSQEDQRRVRVLFIGRERAVRAPAP